MRLRAAAFLLLAAGCVAACASIWGFEDATPGPGAGDGGTVIIDNEVVPAEGANGVVCVPRWPGEWQGPLVIIESTKAADDLPPCPNGYEKPVDGHANPAANGCDCQCDAPTGMSCTPSITIYPTVGDCNGGTNACGTRAVGACSAFPDAGTCPVQDNLGVKVTSNGTPTGGACAKTGSGAPRPAAWSSRARVCAATPGVPGRCPADKVPTPQAALPYAVNYCIAITGPNKCPDLYPTPHGYFTGETDTRKCDCACDAPSGGTCSVPAITGFDSTGCGGAKVDAGSTCVNMAKSSAIALVAPGTVSGATCALLENATGSLQPANPITICCRR